MPAQFLFNVFNEVAFKAFPGLEKYWDIFKSLGAREVHLAGSGPALFAPVPSRELGNAIHLVLKHRYKLDSYLVSCWDPSKDAQ